MESTSTEELSDKPLEFEEYLRNWVNSCKDVYKNWLGMCLIWYPREEREKFLTKIP